ncbi:MAG: MBOAT family protein [Bacteroidales bacterium]|nr:MBOAT family protein [Bacteroidales bacterium]MBN2820060.1 MBOAT family protein [Bacteroidales bacterium]
MVFNSTVFLVFFIFFYFLYWRINNKYSLNARNLFILIASYVFYGWWDWRFLGLIVLSSAVDYFIGLQLTKTDNKLRQKTLLLISLVVNLGVLGFFKYFNFFIDGLNSLLSQFNIHPVSQSLEIILPVGISFYTFQTLSYTIDIYRGKIKPTENILSFFAFVSFFPQLVAGPIERAAHLLPQFKDRKTFNHFTSVKGLRLLLLGFFKKVVIADNFGLLANSIFNPENSPSGLTVFLGACFFALQIYADFSGYSDIAIGISRLLGFDLMINFKTPYFAKSFGDFWKRWHISLSIWFRDYVYIPLGGSRNPISRTYLNLIITFLLSGLWHGANVTFLIWGGLHGLLLIIEKKFRLIKLKSVYFPFVLLLVILFWIPFRAENVELLNSYIKALFSFSNYSTNEIMQILSDFSIRRFIALISVLTAFLSLEYFTRNKGFDEFLIGKKTWFRYLIYYLIIVTIILLGNFNVKPSFIYFQF